MRSILIYNEKSGRSGPAASEEELRSELAAIGWKVERCVSKRQLDDCVFTGADVVVVAGGDGTISRVAKRLAGTNIPMAIVPMGTANNVARSLGLGVDPRIAIRGLANPLERLLDLGVVHSKEPTEFFLEGFGVGVFAYVVGEKASKKDKTLRRALSLIADELDDYAPRQVDIEVDGTDLSGRYVLAAVMNARSLGPTLGVAPDAKCDDGELDVVLVGPETKDALVTHLRRAAEDGYIALPAFETRRATHVRLRADGRWAHIDDLARELDGDVVIDVDPGVIRLVAPSLARTRNDEL